MNGSSEGIAACSPLDGDYCAQEEFPGTFHSPGPETNFGIAQNTRKRRDPQDSDSDPCLLSDVNSEGPAPGASPLAHRVDCLCLEDHEEFLQLLQGLESEEHSEVEIRAPKGQPPVSL